MLVIARIAFIGFVTVLLWPQAADAQRLKAGRSFDSRGISGGGRIGAISSPRAARAPMSQPTLGSRGMGFRNNAYRGGAPLLNGIADAVGNRNRGGSNTPILDALASGGRRSNTPILDALSGVNGRSETPILDALINDGVGRGSVADYLLNDRLGHNYYEAEEAYADAYRDVGIANAVAAVVGTVAHAYISQPRYGYGGYGPGYGSQYAPGHAAQPSGHYERRMVVVQEARYEQYQVYIEPRYDTRTGQLLGGGYNETRTRVIPERYAYQDVWVPHR